MGKPAGQNQPDQSKDWLNREYMVSIIKSVLSIRTSLRYNEQKVLHGKADCLAAVNYPKDLDQLTFENKLNRLLKLAALNKNSKKSGIHISLNFTSQENYSAQKLEKIAMAYMQRLSWGKQPYLIYQHRDAGHPHLHILSTFISPSGQYIGNNQSRLQKARTDTEEEFHLEKSVKISQDLIHPWFGESPLKIQYGKNEMIRSLSKVVNHVSRNYKYASLEELNGVLKLYNIIADRGSKSSFLYQHRGLLYQTLDENGKGIGVPVKASLLYNKPILSFLEKKFAENEALMDQYKKRIRNIIDWSFLKNDFPSLADLIKSLEKESIATVMQTDKETGIERIYYVDHQAKSVLEGSRLGAGYSAPAIRERCRPEDPLQLGESLSLQAKQVLKQTI